MQCLHCGETKIDGFSNYCPNCGKKLYMNDQERNLSRTSKRVLYILPAASLVFVSGLLLAGYHHEAAINEEVIALQKKTEQSALKGNFDKALQYAEKGISLRNDYEVLKSEKELITRIQDYHQDMDYINELIQNNDLEQAAKEIDILTRIVSPHSSPLFSTIQKDLIKADVNVTVGEVKQQINKLNSIDELAEQLKTVSVLDDIEADMVKEQIQSKMVMIGSVKAEKDLSNKQFNSAIVTVDKALQYDGDNEKLLSLKEKIISEKASFEQAEQKRIEKAVSAAKEEERLKAEAIDISNIEVKVDEFGDATTTGKIINTSSHPIHSITVQFTVLNKEGKEIEKGKTNVYPNEVKPGMEADFEHITYGVNEKITLKIKNISWFAN
ncbi:FxLYD domain-containing protein [Metabacillus idriensis]|uniref:FxLYD domain-containing protein n=1 Tax=Metabacillus idriensis TaxID=324768 RepID=UPI00174CC51D|nr:FxLYD domain-containing protein [Metabacillus idriensis]